MLSGSICVMLNLDPLIAGMATCKRLNRILHLIPFSIFVYTAFLFRVLKEFNILLKSTINTPYCLFIAYFIRCMKSCFLSWMLVNTHAVGMISLFIRLNFSIQRTIAFDKIHLATSPIPIGCTLDICPGPQACMQSRVSVDQDLHICAIIAAFKAIPLIAVASTNDWNIFLYIVKFILP